MLLSCLNCRVVSHQRGFALPLALIVLAMLMTLSLALLSKGSQGIENVQIMKQRWEGELQIQNILQQVAWHLMVSVPGRNKVTSGKLTIPLDGTLIKLGGGSVSVQDAAGLMPLEFYNSKPVGSVIASISSQPEGRKLAAVIGDVVDFDANKRSSGMD